MIIPGNLPALIFCWSFTWGLPGHFLFHRPCFLARGWDSIPVAPNVSGTAGQPTRDELTGSRGKRALPTARQTARQPRRAAAPVAIPMNGLPDICIGVGCCCNRPGNRGNTRSRPAPRLRLPPAPRGAAHTPPHDPACPRSRCILSARLRAQCIIQIRFCRRPSV
jgi:hypothetical protein